ncbi:MAG: LysR family transcriptional regulator [Pelagimonas sp.]|uniref:LysR family transcriptional regulator n=1 Tax=Pelagimonas sp. TaxID=2073170 RepID=UPI003D6C1FF9
MTTPDWDDLRIFLAVVRAGSVRGAARSLNKTHATVSRHLQSLHDVLGSPLLERRKEGQCLTDLGQRILPLAEDIEAKVAKIDRMSFSADTGLAGPVTISMLESLYLSVLDKPIDAFMERYPMISLKIIATDELSELAWRDADVVVRLTRSPPETAYGKKVAESPLALYAAPAYLKNRPKRDCWIAFDWRPARQPLGSARTVANASTMGAAARLIEMGRGIGMLPCFFGDAQSGLVRLPELAPKEDLQIWVLTHEDLRKNPRVRALMDHLYDAFEDLKPRIEGAPDL